MKESKKKGYSGFYLSILKYSAQDNNLRHKSADHIGEPVAFKNTALDSGSQFLFMGDNGEIFWFEDEGNNDSLKLKLLKNEETRP